MRIAAYVDWTRSGGGQERLRPLLTGTATVIALDRPPALLAVTGDGIANTGGASAITASVGHVTLIADGRIDNLEDVRRDLGARSDEDPGRLLIQGYLAWGESLPDRLAGDFAVVLWDAYQQRLLALRDPFGVRPLFFRACPDGVWIATKVEQLLATFSQAPVLDDQMAVEYLLWRYKAADATFFSDIRQVRPGHWFSATALGTQVRRYWHPPSEDLTARLSRTEEYREEFRRLFLQSVARRLRSPKPVIVHVSGGLDSSSIAGAADALARAGSLPTPAVFGAAGTYAGLACDESGFVDAVQHHVSFPVERWDAMAADPVDVTAPAIECPGGRRAHIGGTDGDVTIAERYGATVILSGTGGDQLTTPLGVVQDMVRVGDWSGAIRELLLFPGATNRSRAARLRFVMAHAAPLSVRRLILGARSSAPDWLSPRFRELARWIALPEADDVQFVSDVQKHRWENLTGQQVARAVEALQRQVNHTAIEYRFPFLDRDLVQFVLRIPYQHWPRPGLFARFHRVALRDLLPIEVANRFGKGEFTPALINRQTRAKTVVEALLNNGDWRSARYVDRYRFIAFWHATATSRHPRAWLDWRRTWAVATLEAWLRTVLGYYPAH